MRLRSPKTSQERKQSVASKKLVRAKRMKNNLPQSYDDIKVCFQRSWKSFRKTKWKQP